MSLKQICAAMSATVGNPLRKLILIKLADNANDDGECWPSHQYIADVCEVSKSTVRKHIATLEGMGLLSITHREGPKGNSSNLYRLTIQGVPSGGIGMPSESTGGMPSNGTRTSHLLEPVIEPVIVAPTKADAVPYQQIVDLYRGVLVPIGMTNIIKLTDKRKAKIRTFWKKANMNMDKLQGYFADVEQNCRWFGERRPKSDGSGFWQPRDLEFLMSEEVMVKVAEGRY